MATKFYACAELTAKAMGDAMYQYLGRDMIAQIFVNSVKPHRITLAAIGGENVAFWFKGKRYVKHINDVFGQGVTTILDVKG